MKLTIKGENLLMDMTYEDGSKDKLVLICLITKNDVFELSFSKGTLTLDVKDFSVSHLGLTDEGIMYSQLNIYTNQVPDLEEHNFDKTKNVLCKTFVLKGFTSEDIFDIEQGIWFEQINEKEIKLFINDQNKYENNDYFENINRELEEKEIFIDSLILEKLLQNYKLVPLKDDTCNDEKLF